MNLNYILVSALLFVSLGPASAATILASPTSQNVLVGGPASISINVDDVVDLFAWQVDIGFDSSVVSVSSRSNGSFLAAGGSVSFFGGTLDNTAGTISGISSLLNSAPTGVTGSGTLMTIEFLAVTAGNSPITVFNVILLDSNFADISATTQMANILISDPPVGTEVPEPATYFCVLPVVLILVARRSCFRF